MRTVGEDEQVLYLCCAADPVANTYVSRWVLAPNPTIAMKAFRRVYPHIPSWRTVSVLRFEHIALTRAMALGSEVHYCVSEHGSGLVSCDDRALSLHAHFHEQDLPRAGD